MVYKSFRINFVIRIVVLSITIFLLFYLGTYKKLYFTAGLCLIAIVFQIYEILKYVEKTNRLLRNFLESIRYSDFTRNFQVSGLGSSFDKLQESFNEVISDFQKIRAEKEQHYFYLQTVIQHIGISLIAFYKNGKVEMINNASKKLFQINSLKRIQDLDEFSSDLVDALLKLKHGENTLVKVNNGDDILQLSVYATEFKVNNRQVTLVSIKNIQYELEEQEIESWQKLIRVLTHEIMNSITPISSLSTTLTTILDDFGDNNENKFSDDDIETLDEVKMALKTIHKRSSGLLHFVDTYRNLTKIPKPNFSIFTVESLLNNIYKLLEMDIKKNNIKCKIDINPISLELWADEQLIEQVIINLMTNSIHALTKTENAELNISAYLNARGRICIRVCDNGQGIIKEVLDKIFIPFFTTKPTGSGIGLSLSKQILRLHGGTITAQSEPDIKTCFTLTF
ncbi:MAG: ATP-binding protein [Marinifilaceae bacterium]|jgi:nitrogen fixation/metabolism regulation signal transduction histidine kinase|nr:ATP-binding protein [Marinifilaceae bacterium]